MIMTELYIDAMTAQETPSVEFLGLETGPYVAPGCPWETGHVDP